MSGDETGVDGVELIITWSSHKNLGRPRATFSWTESSGRRVSACRASRRPVFPNHGRIHRTIHMPGAPAGHDDPSSCRLLLLNHERDAPAASDGNGNHHSELPRAR